MEKKTEEFIDKLSAESQDLIKNVLFIRDVIKKFLADHDGKFFISDLGNKREVNESRFIGELNLSEMELFVIQGFLLAQIIEQKDVVRRYKNYAESMKEVGFATKETQKADGEYEEQQQRLTTLFQEYDETANSVNSFIWQRLENEIDAVLKKDSYLKKFPFRYNAFRMNNVPGLIFRIYDGNKIILDNIYVPGGD